MLEVAENSSVAAAPDTDATLVTPRFDEAEAQTAQPVVPLAAVRTKGRVWPLLLVSALLGGVVSIGGLYLYQRPHAQAVAAPVAVAPEATAAAPPETAQIDTAADAQTQVRDRARADMPAEAAIAPAQSAERAATVAVREPVRRSASKKEEKAQPARDAGEARTQRVVARETRGIEVSARRNAEPNNRPREAQPRDTKPKGQTRNVDRIRDIFEGARPPV